MCFIGFPEFSTTQLYERVRLQKKRVKKKHSYSRFNSQPIRVVAFHGAPMMVPVERSDSNAVA